MTSEQFIAQVSLFCQKRGVFMGRAMFRTLNVETESNYAVEPSSVLTLEEASKIAVQMRNDDRAYSGIAGRFEWLALARSH